MKKTLLLTLAIIILSSSTVFGQFNILNKVKEKTKTTKTTNNDSSNEDVAKTVVGKTPFKNKIDVVLAKASAVNRVTDGDALWLYIKFNGTLADYVYKNPYADSDGNINYILFTELGPRGEESSYDNESLIFKKEQLGVSELKIALAPGIAGRNKSLSIFLDVVGGGQPGVWENEIRISNNPSLNQKNGDYLAKVAITCDVADGLPKYRAMKNNYSAIISKGSVEDNKLPAATSYVNNQLKAQILAKLKAEGVVPVKFFFTSEGWEEYSDSQTDVKQNRKIYAAYTYKKGAECLYGIAEVVQNYSYYSASYGATNIFLRKDYPISCAQ